MASRVSKLLTDIRAELADPNKERWSDTRLLKLLSNAQIELAHETRVLIARATIPVVAGVAEYTLDSNADIILRASNEYGPIETFSQFEMDDFKPDWETAVGPAVERVVYDLLTPNKIIVYPIPSADNSAESYTFEAGDSNLFVGGELLGLVAAIDNYSFNSPLGVVTSLAQPSLTEAFNSPFGIVTGISESVGTLKIQYSKRPAKLTSIDSSLELSEAFDLAMLHLTVSNAFTADIDTNSDALANKHYKLYQVQLARLKSNKAHNQAKGANARIIVRNPYAG